MSKFLYPIYKLKIDNYKKWWLYHKKAGGGGVLSDILEGFSFTLDNSLSRKFKIFEILGNSIQDGEPSPENEVPILSSGDNVNLFDKTAITDNTSINNNTGATYTETNSFSTDFIDVSNYKNICWNGYSGSSKTQTWGAFYDENKNYSSKIALTNNVQTIAISENAKYVRLGFLKEYLETLKLEPGTTATPYSPYGMGSITEKIVNKNLFNATKESETTVNYTLTKNNDGTYIASNGSTSYAQLTLLGTINVKSGITYYLSGGTNNNNSISLRRNTTALITSVSQNTATPYTATADETLNIYLRYQSVESIIYKPMICIFNDANYVPHEEQTYSIYTQQPFRSNKDKTVRDCFVKKSDGWYERHKLIELIADGVNFKANYIFPSGRFNLNDNNGEIQYAKSISNNQIGNVLCNRLIAETFTNLSVNNKMGISLGSNGTINLKLDDSSDNSINNWTKESINLYFNSNPFIIQVELAEPLDLPCTQSQIDILENIPSTFAGQTNVYSEDEVEAYVKLQYYKEEN